jgi:glycerol uptake facilitator-like aquaporin
VPANWSKVCVAEAIGAFTLVFIGVLAISGVHFAGLPDGMANLASIGLAHGLAIAVMVAALGAISGGTSTRLSPAGSCSPAE